MTVGNALALLTGLQTRPEHAALSDQIAEQERNLARQVPSDPGSFTVLYERYYGRILSFFYRRVHDRDLAEDLTSQVFLASFKHLHSAAREVVFFAWIYRVATNTWISHERTKLSLVARLSAWARTVPQLTRQPALEQMDEQQTAETVRRLLFALPPRYREPILLKYYEELPYTEIAQVLGITQSGARSRVMRGLRIVRRQLGLLQDETGEENLL